MFSTECLFLTLVVHVNGQVSEEDLLNSSIEVFVPLALMPGVFIYELTRELERLHRCVQL